MLKHYKIKRQDLINYFISNIFNKKTKNQSIQKVHKINSLHFSTNSK